ncbi:MAG: bifunctional DNA-formamidopyrimidine glycosylase/DNA-(apurinic or apyrimidinic site) lyase [Phycisphaerales bacterium]|nr:MAG: bifunctional DNA-formamidopyrimidine glycosylase/DNA-(apurinic or apyrimidinic site) lyase [Phycisphaerales bacterium]
MPELPEVERVRATLEPGLVGRTVASVAVHRRDVVVAPGDPPGGFSRQRSAQPPRPVRLDRSLLLRGERITGVLRRGKQLAIVSETRAVVVHLGMTGQLRLLAPGVRLTPAGHVHVRWTLADASALLFRDPRRFGGVWALTGRAELAARWGELGPDAIGITPDELASAFAGVRASLKVALLDQRRLAGLGNIYADEAAFDARLHPARLAGSLSGAEVARLASSIRGTLTRALAAGGSTLRDYADAEGRSGRAQLEHRVYGRAGQACRRCRGVLASGVLAQRTTVWCPRCQPQTGEVTRSGR